MSDGDLFKLYSQRILGLAAAIPHLGSLPAPRGEGRKRAPLCGSVVSAQVVARDGRITEFAQDVRACALGQASAAVLGSAVIGCNLAELERGRDELAAMLRAEGPVPGAPFAGYDALLPARAFPNRHESILLAFEAVIAALRAAAD
ncbi:MAG: iron-sulfur cluster assembly scaffold protein [Phaeovulum sp.]|uniref:iron-sulfur cluster assembly scaffold protein n=1 Tax=Phaeovulum sp. TaxID=2934796 RepID=UPI002735CC97|nr:iron-sulfur cluster assembly scaffold protein [Phaeovulum sp.]MDP3860037.1 iron-sulfur cluster assembly scaffold protein [Phaeovulum sp.]